MATTEKKGSAISKREALDKDGKDVADYTEALTGRYTFLATGKAIVWDVSHIERAIDRALAIEGFLNKAGHAVNKAVNNKTEKQDPGVALDDFLATLNDGGWTNREGGNEVGLATLLEAFAQFKNVTPEAAREKWTGVNAEGEKTGEGYNDETKARIRGNVHVKAIVKEIQAAKARKAANDAASGDKAKDDLADI